LANPKYLLTKEGGAMIKEAIAKVVKGEDMTEGEMQDTMADILTAKATSAQIGSFLTALRIKGETVDEITGAAKALRASGQKLVLTNHLVAVDRDEINVDEETIVDTCGTGGEGTNTFNVSTATAFVVAGAGVKVAKYGQRTDSSLCGSATVLEALGVNLDINTAGVEKCIQEVGIGFLYGPRFYGTMRYPTDVRQEIGIRTIFNLLGPLTNPAGAPVQILGVYSPELTEKIAQVLKKLDTKQAFVVYGEGTFDEISICGPTRISHLKEGTINTFIVTPEEYGFKRANPEDIRGGSAGENARIIREILEGHQGPKRDTVLFNAGAALVAAGLDKDFKAGIERAREAIDSGRARQKLDAMVSFTQQCGYLIREEL
jgi:anthranilate phosphoribosyltransferase